MATWICLRHPLQIDLATAWPASVLCDGLKCNLLWKNFARCRLLFCWKYRVAFVYRQLSSILQSLTQNPLGKNDFGWQSQTQIRSVLLLTDLPIDDTVTFAETLWMQRRLLSAVDVLRLIIMIMTKMNHRSMMIGTRYQTHIHPNARSLTHQHTHTYFLTLFPEYF